MQNCTKAKNNINVEKRIWKFCNYIKYVQTGGCYGVAKFNWSHTIIVICSIKTYKFTYKVLPHSDSLPNSHYCQ